MPFSLPPVSSPIFAGESKEIPSKDIKIDFAFRKARMRKRPFARLQYPIPCSFVPRSHVASTTDPGRSRGQSLSRLNRYYGHFLSKVFKA